VDSTTPLSLDQFDFALDPACIAQAPVQPRDHSRLMHLAPKQPPAHHRFLELPNLLRAGDLLVVNRTQVIPARLHLTRPTGGKAELLLHTPVDDALPAACVWQGLGRPGSALKPGAKLLTRQQVPIEVVARDGAVITVKSQGPMWPILQAEGKLPLPPYLRHAHEPGAEDARDYQSMFASERGAVAAPTASLHFTPRVMAALAQAGVLHTEVVLHVGPGTFLPIRSEHETDITQHQMHAEAYQVPEAAQAAVAAAKKRGGRVIAVGTTALRALETWAHTQQAKGQSTLFVYPGYSPKVIDGLVTNFHLPKSTLLLLVSALAGRERMLAAYSEAAACGYRFFSYGDAMLIL
jgi:S-adenosylmethionine:tRNA ribosyltransferase-isomerase